MRTLALLVCVLGCFVAAAAAHGGGDGVATYATDSPVTTLTEDSFETYLEANPTGYIEFFAPWCGHCKTLKPAFEEAAKQGKADGVLFAAYDASAGGQHGSKYGVQGFPTIKYFKNGEAFDYEGERSASALLEFARKMSRDPITTVATSADVAALLSANPFTIVGEFASDASEARLAFRQVAQKNFLKFAFVEVTAAAAASRVRAEVDSIEEAAIYDGDLLDVEALGKWAAANCVPLVDTLDARSWRGRVVESQLGSFVAFVDPVASSEETARVMNILKTAAQAFRGRGQFFTADGVQLARFAESLGLGAKLPSMAVICPAKDDTKFAMKTDFTLENVLQFAEDYVNEKLVRVYKSAEAPADNSGPVFVLTHDTFQAEVLDTPKSVLVEFWAPWCGHCKSLAPIYAELGEKFKSRSDVRIASLDMDANEISGKYGVRGFPTIIMFPAGDKENFVTYSGNRDLESLTKFVEESAGAVTSDDDDEEEKQTEL